MVLERAMAVRRGTLTVHKAFLCRLCVSATVGSTCVDVTPLLFILHEEERFRVTWGKLADLQKHAWMHLRWQWKDVRGGPLTWEKHYLSKAEQHSVFALVHAAISSSCNILFQTHVCCHPLSNSMCPVTNKCANFGFLPLILWLSGNKIKMLHILLQKISFVQH